MRRNTFNQYIKDADFRGLFITEMGWNRFHGQAELAPIAIEDKEYRIITVAERNGFQILACSVDEIPTNTLCKRIDSKLRRSANDYICIFFIPGTEHQQWIAPVKTVEKRDIVTIEYENADKADFLFSKLSDLSFDIDEQTTIVDVKERIQGAFAVNSEKITKDFYAGFRKEHKAFVGFISGIDDQIPATENRNKQWYTSVMLNRLMFCYFIQKKGFLDGNFDYLQEKLRWVQRERGENRFFKTFYRGFLSELFHGGLNSPKHSDEFENVYGRIPYLNGGMFEEHQLEREYKDIDISDDAFVRLFKFFDTWRWHLDTRITASGKDINPDVLGYIFEQYINDRAQMGAYYTKEDITEYIGKNCILPFLMDKVSETSPEAFKPDGYVWRTLCESGDRYIYDAVKKGYTANWQSRIPENIAIGLDTTKPGLLERRKDWNTETQEAFALPTEIWRETVERLQRCEEVLAKIRKGEITHINDFVTYNLDIRSFVYDLLHNTDDRLFVLHFYKALQRVTILDPTCGSGAFLFAAMNILEPLYEVCIERMQEFNAQNPNWFKPELEEIAHKYRSNIQYFIYKSIILRNLYGVDIMVEATEIAKLRLFLKMMAVVEVDFRADNLGLDPLPDIDFNIRCGNTLVGYATEDELLKDLDNPSDFNQMWANDEFKDKLKTEMQLVATAYDTFKTVQFTQSEDMVTFKQAKRGLNERLGKLNELLNRRLHAATTSIPYEDWLEKHQPYHWLAEFYQIIHDNGGFDVIIGNPPYVTFTDKSIPYNVDKFETKKDKNLFALVGEQCTIISNSKSSVGYIIPLSGLSIEGFKEFQRIIFKQRDSWNSFYSGDRNPSELFTGVKIRAGIFISRPQSSGRKFVTKYIKYYTSERPILFNKINYTECFDYISAPKLDKEIGKNVVTKIFSFDKKLSSEFYKEESIYYHAAPIYWCKALINLKILTENNLNIAGSYKKIDISNRYKNFAFILLNSTLFFYFWIAFSDCYNLTQKYFSMFRIPNVCDNSELKKVAKELSNDMIKNMSVAEYNYKNNGMVRFAQFFPKLSKPIIDEIDKILAKYYGFTEEELDFIINYDIKYRMGDELNEE
ncbi:Eco57I restriction-modification methylase domain-containing protein [Barnesiella viscericola]|uniref:Eco57I restriction-modification methylase domain-containing protein n=1 Tax=Barnesiella viscericola TaxID=397865 RepID=UPI00320BB34C